MIWSRIILRMRNEKEHLQVRWIKPQAGWVKLNTDASALGAPGPLKGGGLIRDDKGQFLGGFTANLGISFAFEAELAAALIKIEIAFNRDWKKLWIESDFLYVVYMLNALKSKVPWKCLKKWRLIKRHLNSIHWFGTHVYREVNTCVDCLASYNGDNMFYW